MKKLIWILFAVVALTGCSKSGNKANPVTPTVATDLGKSTKYFSDLYGSPVSQKRLGSFDFALQSVGHPIRLSADYLSHQFTNGNLCGRISHSKFKVRGPVYLLKEM